MIDICNPSEYARLKTVVMRFAEPFTADFSDTTDFPESVQRQLEHNHFEVFDHTVVRKQQQGFIDVMRERGIEVLLADRVPGCLAGHYTRDIGFAVDDTFIVGRPHSPGRQQELVGLRPIVEQMSKVAYLDAGTIEGGDVMLHDGCVLVGLGEETSPLGIDALRYRLGRLGIDREVVPVSFARGGVIHLDTLFNIVAPGVALIHRPAFTPESLAWFDARFDLVEVTEQEARRVYANTFSLAPDAVALAATADRIAEELERRGIEPVPIDYSEVTKVPGSLRCSTLPLVREA